MTNAFGIFETFYTETWLTSSTPSAIAWIGSIQLFLTLLVGVFAGWLLDAGYLQFILIAGGFLEVFGLMMTSLSTEYWQILLAQGICVGVGSGLLGLTSVSVIPMYFEKKRMIAMGIAATGSSLGEFPGRKIRYAIASMLTDTGAAGILYPIMLRRLFITIGFPWAVRIMGFIIMACLAVCCAVMRLRPRPRRVGALINLGHFRDPGYMVFVAGTWQCNSPFYLVFPHDKYTILTFGNIAFVLMISSVYVPFFFIQKYALKLSVDNDMAFYLLSIMNATSLIGRVGPNFLADQ